MATLEDVRRIALDLPDAVEAVDGHRGGVAWRTRNGLFVWERPPSKTDLSALAALGRVWPEGVIIGVRTDGLEGKRALLGSTHGVFFSIPHFDGYPAVLVRLERIDRALLDEVVTDAWLLRAPKRVAQEWLAAHRN